MARRLGLGGGVAVLACVIFTGCQTGSGSRVASNNPRGPAIAKQSTPPTNNLPSAGAGNFNASAGGNFPTQSSNVAPVGASGPQTFNPPVNANRTTEYPNIPAPTQPGFSSPSAPAVPPPPPMPTVPTVPPVPQQPSLGPTGIQPIQ